jgi:hypothetical protein
VGHRTLELPADRTLAEHALPSTVATVDPSQIALAVPNNLVSCRALMLAEGVVKTAADVAVLNERYDIITPPSDRLPFSPLD